MRARVINKILYYYSGWAYNDASDNESRNNLFTVFIATTRSLFKPHVNANKQHPTGSQP